MKTSVNSKNRKYTLLAWLLAVLVVAVAVPVNLIVDRLDVHFDMTPNSLYTLTDSTEEYLDALDAEGTVVDVYFLTKMEDLESDPEVLALYRTLLQYDAHACFNLIDFDPDTEPAILRDLDPEGVYNLGDGDFLFRCGDMVKRLPGNMMYAYQTETDSEGNEQVVSAEFQGENLITGYMNTVVEGVMPTVYFLQGHGETPLEEMTKLQTNLRNYNYNVQPLNLLNADKVPEDACILIIAAPERDISEEELDKIMDFTDLGGNVSLLMTPNDAQLSYTNITTLLNSFCIGMDYNRISETDTARYKSNDPYTFMCDIQPPSPDANEENDLTSGLAEVNDVLTYMPASRSFYTVASNNYTACAQDTLLKTASTAHAEPFGGTIEDPESVDGRELTLSMYSVDSMRQNAKCIVFGSGEFITDEGVSNEFFIMPLQLFLSSITWMYDSDVDMNIADKERYYDSLNVNSSNEARGLMALFVVVPAAVALAGVVVWLRRKDA